MPYRFQIPFHRVRHEKIIKVLKWTGFDGKELKIKANLYWNQTAVLRIEADHTDHVKILRGCTPGEADTSCYNGLCKEKLKESEPQDQEEYPGSSIWELGSEGTQHNYFGWQQTGSS